MGGGCDWHLLVKNAAGSPSATPTALAHLKCDALDRGVKLRDWRRHPMMQIKARRRPVSSDPDSIALKGGRQGRSGRCVENSVADIQTFIVEPRTPELPMAWVIYCLSGSDCGSPGDGAAALAVTQSPAQSLVPFTVPMSLHPVDGFDFA
jgi:hypothetical protein